MQWRLKHKTNFPIIPIGPWELDTKELRLLLISLAGKGMLTMVIFFIVCILTACSSVFFIHILGTEYQNSSLQGWMIYEEEAEQNIEERIRFQLGEEAIWEGQTLTTYVEDVLTGELGELYEWSAAGRVSAYAQYIPKIWRIEKAQRLTNFNAYLSFPGNTEKRKDQMNELADNLNELYYEDYVTIFNEYDTLSAEYEQELESISAGKIKLNIDGLMALRERIVRLQEKIIPQKYVKLLHIYRTTPKRKTQKIEMAEDCCISRLEKHHVYSAIPEEDKKTKKLQDMGLQKDRKKVIFDCEDTFMEVYDALDMLNISLNDLLQRGTGNPDFSPKKMATLLSEYDSLLKSKMESDEAAVDELDELKGQLLECINYRYASNYIRSRKQAEAVELCITLYRLANNLRKFRQEAGEPAKTLADCEIRAKYLAELMERCGSYQCREDLPILDRYCFRTDFADSIYFLMFLYRFQWQITGLSDSFDNLRQSFLGDVILFFILYLVLIWAGTNMRSTDQIHLKGLNKKDSSFQIFKRRKSAEYPRN